MSIKALRVYFSCVPFFFLFLVTKTTIPAVSNTTHTILHTKSALLAYHRINILVDMVTFLLKSATYFPSSVTSVSVTFPALSVITSLMWRFIPCETLNEPRYCVISSTSVISFVLTPSI